MVDYVFEANDCQATRNKMCIADECMAWGCNFEDGEITGYQPDVHGTRYPVHKQVFSKTDGYCKRLN